MEELGPVTLVVKAPNQRIEDKVVDCDKSWTVRQLKEHLATVYPDRPHEDNQRLVYYGKLLEDRASLHEVLCHGSDAGAHTVHLVCPPRPTTGLSDEPVKDTTPAGQPPADVSSASDVYQLPHNLTSQLDWLQQYQQYHTELSPQQRLWLQAYQQQLYWYSMNLQYNHDAIHRTQNDSSNAAEAAAGAGVAQPNQAPAADPMVQMNAQGGVDAEIVQRDWLDYIYTSFRLLMLVALLSSYTTPSRFLAVLVGCLFFYLAQGNLRLQRRRAPPAAEVIQQPAEQNQAENQNNENEERNINSDEAAERQRADDVINNNVEDRSNLMDSLRVVFTFFITFFHSLIPQNPAIAAGN